MAWNPSTQSMPLGSCSEKMKHEKAVLNCSPHGPCAMPPRQGQSQLISPVTGLYAPDRSAPSSSSSTATAGSGGSSFNTSSRRMASRGGGGRDPGEPQQNGQDR